MTRDDVLAVLQWRVGAEYGASAAQLVREITGGAPTPAAERELRERIVELRLDGAHVCGHPATGYYLAATDEELQRTCLFLYDRAITSLQQIAAMKRISLPDLRGQLRLPT